MLKTRSRKRHARSTRKKCINCTGWTEKHSKQSRKKRYQNKRKRSNRRHMRGGRSDEPTTKTVEGFPVTKEAVVSIPGWGSADLKALRELESYADFQGTGGDPGYD